MDPPPPPQPQLPPPTTTTTTTTATPTTTTPTTTSAPATYPDSIDSSPRSRTTDSFFDDPLPPSSLPSKLRLMCSYGGHIVPRPHDKSLCYVGGDTRIVVVDRNVSLHSLSTRLSSTLLNNRPFTLKYQLPNEDLDSLISVTTDEDLENMIDEYDRTNAVKSRLRLFLFPLKPDSSQSLGPMIDNSVKSEDWFVDALNGATECLNRGFSDSASVNCLLGLDDDGLNGQNGQNLEFGGGGAGAGGGGGVEGVKRKQGQDVHSVPDSPMLETTSSFGSTSSSPSLANLPPIKVHVDEGVGGGGGGAGGGVVRGFANDQKLVGIEEQFSQISVGGSGGGQKQDDCFGMISSPPPMPVSFAVPGMAMGAPVVVGEFQNRVVSDDERSDHGVPVGYRKPPQPQTLGVQAQQKSSVGGDVPSPDSVSSDSSFSNTVNRQRPAIYQDQVVQMAQGVSRAVANPADSKINMSDPNTRVQIQQQVAESGYLLQPQFDQQQHFIQQQPQFDQQQQPQQHFIQQQPQFDQQQQPQQHFIQQQPQFAHYIHHNPTGTVPMSAYYPVYPTPQQQQLPQQHHPQLDQQYPVYYVQARHPQAAYNIPVQQSNIGDASVTAVPSSRPQTPPNPVVMPSSAAQNPVRNVPVAKPEMGAAGMYRQVNTGTPQFVQVPSSQHQQQYVGYSQVHHPSQSVAPTSATGGTNYAYDYTEPAHAQVYYTQPLAPPLPSQYQTILPEASSQLPTETIKQQQIRTSQPI